MSPVEPPRSPISIERAAQRCPVCFGKGIVPGGFYRTTERTWSTGSEKPEPCRGCYGSGVVR